MSRRIVPWGPIRKPQGESSCSQPRSHIQWTILAKFEARREGCQDSRANLVRGSLGSVEGVHGRRDG
jgi:hypothetical protein